MVPDDTQNIPPPGPMSSRTRAHAWNTVEKLRDADANRFYTEPRPSCDPSVYKTFRRSRRQSRKRVVDPTRVEWLTTRHGNGVEMERPPLAEPGGDNNTAQNLGWTYDGDRWVLTAFDEQGVPKPQTPLAPPRVTSRQHLPKSRAQSRQENATGSLPTNRARLPTNRGYSAAANLYQLERVYMDDTAPRSTTSHGLFDRRVTPRRDVLARHPLKSTLCQWGTIQQHNNWVVNAGPPGAWGNTGKSYTHEGRK